MSYFLAWKDKKPELDSARAQPAREAYAKYVAATQKADAERAKALGRSEAASTSTA